MTRFRAWSTVATLGYMRLANHGRTPYFSEKPKQGDEEEGEWMM